MELNDFIVKFAAQFDETELSEFTPDTEFKELDDWSSMVGMSIIDMVKEEYDKDIGGSALRQCETVEELFNFIASK